MTGFARASGHDDSVGWTWEAKSVNARGLDLRCRLPAGMVALETVARAAAAKRFKRGNLALNLQIDSAGGATRLAVNRAALDRLVALARARGVAAPRIETLLTVRGVVEITEAVEDADLRGRREAAMAVTLEQCLDALAQARAEEGARLDVVLGDEIDRVAALVETAAASAGARPDAARARLEDKLAELRAAVPALDEERVAQEMAILVVKGDVREEIDRLIAHVAAARELLAAGGAVGRRLDFLAQEFNREANTLCGKANDLELTRIGLELKAVIDQFREQVQNVE